MAKEKKYSLAMIPARAGSKRLPGKNKRVIAGKPLISYTIEAALESDVFDEVCVSTDDLDIINIANEYENVTVDKRPESLANSKVQCGEVILYLLNKKKDMGVHVTDITQLQATCPLRTGKQIYEATAMFREKEAGSVVSVSEYDFPIQFNLDILSDNVISTNWEGLNRTDNVKPKYHPNGAIIILNAEEYIKNNSYYPEKSYAYVMDWETSVDIDEEEHIRMVELIIAGRSVLDNKLSAQTGNQ